PAEIVVRFENQDARIGAGLLAEEVRRRQSADTRTYHDEIVRGIRAGWPAGGLPKSSVTQPVRGFKRPRVIAAHPARRRRTVTRAILRSDGIRGSVPRTPGQRGTERQAADPDGDPVQKIAARHGAVHAQIV